LFPQAATLKAEYSIQSISTAAGLIFSMMRDWLRHVRPKKHLWISVLIGGVISTASPAGAQLLTDLGTATSTPGPNDISQLSTNGSTTSPDSLNYYSDNSSPAGQTFITASNTTGLASLAIKTAGLNSGGGYGTPAMTPTYYLRLYSFVGSNATLVTTFTATNPTFVDGDWLCWSNLWIPLVPNSVYGYSFGIKPASGGYCAMAVAGGNRYVGGEIALIPIAGGGVTFGASHGYDAMFDLGLTTNIMPVLTDIGPATPTPGPNDISQLSTNGNITFPDGLNFFSNNSNPPGQTFTNGSNATNLVALAVRTGGLSSSGGYGTPATITNYYLRIYSVSGSTATLIQGFTNLNPGFTDGEWLKWNNLSVPLAANGTYAFSVSVLPGGSTSWFALAVASGNRYAGGEIALIPINGGTMTFGGSHNYDAVFDLGMLANSPTANTPLVSPRNTVYVGQTLNVTESALGTGTFHYQWETDGGGGGSLTNIPNANGSNITTTVTSIGTYNYNVIVTNSYGSETSRVTMVTVLAPVSVSVDASKPLAAMPLPGLGVCTATYDNVLINSNIAPLLMAAGIGAVRYPGGSYADIFNWQTTTGNNGAYVNSNDSFTNFINTIVNPSGAQAIITVNYGSNPSNTGGGDTNAAAAWVAYANVTNHWGIKYWEIGNEVGGNGYSGVNLDWEYDLHYPETNAATRVGQPALSPAAYGSNSVQFISAMKAQDPTIKCGVGYAVGNNAYNTPLLQAVGTNADFVVIHWYPGSDTASTLAASTGIVATVTSTFTELTNTLGATHASQMKIAVTETGAGGAVGAPASLYTADNYLTWIENGIVNVDYQILHDDILLDSQTPGHAYYGVQMAHLLANVGDTFLNATSAVSELHVHATTRQDGKTGIMLVNMDPLIAITATVNISGPDLASSGICYQFGLTNYIGANDYPSYPVSSNTVSGLGNSFTVSVPAYTIVNLLIPQTVSNAPPVLATINNQTVNVGQIVAFTASASETNVPAQTLTFTLLAGATNATLTQINNTNANFIWRPLTSQAESTNTFTLAVTDNGTPALEATQSFTVVVNPLTPPGFASLVKTAGQFSFVVNGEAGPNYEIQASTNLTQWRIAFITNSPALPFNWTDTNTGNLPARYYRVIVGLPLP